MDAKEKITEACNRFGVNATFALAMFDAESCSKPPTQGESTMKRDEQIGKMILEASTGLHGDMARDIAQAWCDIAHKKQELQSRLESLEQEMQEQARIIGMGAERELALVAKVEFLEKRASQALIHLAQCLDQVYSGEVDHDLEHLADHARADASILSGVDLDVQANKGE